MTKKDLFRVIIKLFGLYVATSTIILLPQTLVPLFWVPDWFYLFVAIVSLAVLIGVVYILLVKTDRIIQFFKLEKGFDNTEDETKHFSPDSIIQLGIVIISIYFIVDGLPDILTNIFYAFKRSIPQNSMETLIDKMSMHQPNYYILTSASLKLILSVLLLMNKKRIAKRIEKWN